MTGLIRLAIANRLARQLGKTLYHQGDLSYFEAVNKETLKNSYQRFEEEGIIHVVKSKDAKVPPRLCLAPEWQPPRDPATGALSAIGSRLWDFTEKIASSRREGKNRRDGATVSTRVVRLTDMLGRKLFEEAVSGAREKGKGKWEREGQGFGEGERQGERKRKGVREDRRRGKGREIEGLIVIEF